MMGLVRAPETPLYNNPRNNGRRPNIINTNNDLQLSINLDEPREIDDNT